MELAPNQYTVIYNLTFSGWMISCCIQALGSLDQSAKPLTTVIILINTLTNTHFNNYLLRLRSTKEHTLYT